ncbi:hypothetical protein B0F90DRAFT_1817309 [Multifurca ochricompacta]|uniref:Uncharacterized protein n=1 Tax=Multifurca ochricompacta TaxID=376703 RepID=A0AAD4QKY5_9AGAM|nr:hypothetical protein B0F90DRAFT_1817309 [Multifurca ochricompacta]
MPFAPPSAVMALVSLMCIILSLSLYEHYDPKTDLCVLIAVPGLCLTTSVIANGDKDVWFRDITGSPSPFPIDICLYKVKLWLRGRGPPSEKGNAQQHPSLCLPGCSCKEKIPPSSPPTTLLSDQVDFTGPRSNVPGVRVPTAWRGTTQFLLILEYKTATRNVAPPA